MSDEEIAVVKSKSLDNTRRKRLRFKEEEEEETDEIMQAPPELTPWATDKEVGEGLISSTSDNIANKSQVKSLEGIIEQQEEYVRQQQFETESAASAARLAAEEEEQKIVLLKIAFIGAGLVAGYFLMKWLVKPSVRPAAAAVAKTTPTASAVVGNSGKALSQALSEACQ